MAHSLRRAVTLVLLTAAVAGGWRPGSWMGSRAAVWGVAVVVTLALVAAPLPVVGILASVVVVSALALDRDSRERIPFLAAAWSVAVFALYRLMMVAIPGAWLAADRAGSMLGMIGGWVGPALLSTGTTYAGFDYLVLQAALFTFWFAQAPPPRAKATLSLAGCIVFGHLAYLILVSSFPIWVSWLPTAAPPAAADGPGTSHPPKQVAELLLWHLPALGAVIHLVVVALVVRHLRRRPEAPALEMPARADDSWMRPLHGRWGWILALALASAVPALGLLNTSPLSLRGRKVVVHEKGFLNWFKPKHGDYGRLSIGMYGMLPAFFESYGAELLISPELSEADLQGADLAILIYPNKPWSEGQLDRIWRFVHEGGALLVLGEHTVREKDGGCRFNEVLEPTAMRVEFDSAMFAVGGWLHSYEILAHPASLGLPDDRNQAGVVIGASVRARWPARPLLVGRWGWADPGDIRNDESKGGSLMGNQRYDPGERLGDVLLAAEQRLGRGRVVAFGDTSGFTNGILFGSHPYAAALFAALCQDLGFGGLRQGLTLIGCVLLIGLLWLRRYSATGLGVALALSVSAALSVGLSRRAADLLPDGRPHVPNRLAYIDATHLERSSGESWRNNGLGGLELTLMRNGYLALSLPEFTTERLDRAGVLVSVAPGRPFSRQERAALRQFIEGGGLFICTVGWTEASASREMLAELGFYVGGHNAALGIGPEPAPFGHFKAPYHNGGDYLSYVRFHAAWPVESSDLQARALAYGPRDPSGSADQADPAVILMRRIGRGKVVVIADSDFATNQNLEHEGGQPFEGLRENAEFWRWLLTYLNDQPLYLPPKPNPPPPATNAPPPAPMRS